MYHKQQSYDVWFLRYMVCDGQNFLSFWTIFYTLNPLTTQKTKDFEKNEKMTWRYYHFTHVYHKWQSYDIWFLRHSAQQKEFYVILDYFLPFYHPNKCKVLTITNKRIIIRFDHTIHNKCLEKKLIMQST